MKFDDLAKRISENTSYQLNDAGRELLKKYHNLIREIENGLIPVISPYVSDVENAKKELAVQILSSISSNKMGNDLFIVMNNIDTLTNGGKSNIDGNTFAFSQNDPILNYLEPIN